MNRRTFLLSSLASSALCRPLSALAETQQQIALREKLMHDPLRPQFHLLPKANWMNDPCAPRWFDGQYHMFFQYNPHAAIWGDMHWAHAISPDLIHWQHLPLALSPTPGSSDAYGCFTGSVLPGLEVPAILYTGVTKVPPQSETIRGEGIREVQCLATSTDPDLRVWSKLDKPVLDGPPSGLHVTGFRDPCPWKDGDKWYLIIGSGFNKIGGAVLLYTSADGRNWTYLHPLAQGKWNQGTQTNPVDTGEMWECPDFFPLGDKHVLLYSTERKVFWEVGTFDKRELVFHSETRGLLDHGSYYAMKSMVDAQGRRILWGWVQETRTPAEHGAAGWAGAMALPRILTLDPDNNLRTDVPLDFESLRDESSGSYIKNRAAEILCQFHAGQSACGLDLRAEGKSIFAIRYEGGGKPVLNVSDRAVPLSPGADGISLVRLWMDGSVLEVFVDRKEAVTARCYEPSRGDIEVAWTGEKDALKTLQVWGMEPISHDRLTS
jgi:beta-fructofuranosidase